LTLDFAGVMLSWRQLPSNYASNFTYLLSYPALLMTWPFCLICWCENLSCSMTTFLTSFPFAIHLNGKIFPP